MSQICPKLNFSKLIDSCTADYEDRKIWCNSDVLNVLLKSIKYHPETEQTINRLFCFRGNVFTCPICFGKSVDNENPISMIKNCGHRFHANCLKELIRKNSEWDDICRHEWALNVELNCPNCRVPFQPKDILLDNMMTEMCAYNSDTEV